jgi:cereblon
LFFSIDCAVQRLRAELSFLGKCHVLSCRRCSLQLGDQSEIFSLSREGPQGAFVNPGGHVHETLTVYRAKNLRLTGTPSTEYSWFPGYAWTIAECGRCYNHIGWKFTATNRQLIPDKFYGFSRRSIEARIQVPHQDMEEAEQRSPENQIVM